MKTIHVKPGALDRYTAAHWGQKAATARDLNIARQTLRRALDGAAVSAGFVATIVDTLGVDFKDVFYIADDAPRAA